MSTWSGNLRSSRTTSSLRNRSSNIAESNDGLSPTSPRQRRENQEKELHGEYRVELGARIILLLNASVKNRSDAAQRNETVSDDELSKLLSMSVEGFGLLQHSSEILEHISVDTGRDSSRSMKTTTTLPPIQVKVEDSTCSPSTSYAEPQPSVATPVSASGPFTSHTPSVTTPRGSVAAGMESNVEKAAKQEAQVLSRIAELRRQGLWSQTRLPIIEMPPRNKTHWDYLLEEMRWMSVDFKQERHFKRHAAKKFATQISRLVRDKELENERSEQRAVKDAKRICALIAKAVRDFWLNVEKVVDFRKQEVIEAMKRRALDQQLEIIVGHADKLSEMVQKGLAEDKLSQNTHEERDDEYEYEELDSDDESSLIKEEEKTKGDWKEEVSELTKQGTLEFNDFMDMLPPGYLDQYKEPEDTAILQTSRSKRKHESLNCSDSENELSLDENNSVDPVRKKRRLNYDEPSTSRDHSINMSIERGGRLGAGEVIKSVASDEALPKEDKNIMEINFGRLALESSEERQKELTNIAEEALKLQPKGFTLETTHVKTEIPHLIRGVLREYQLVGLDWLVTLYEKGLNGILADEMGLGKTIQTIALLAHLACKDNNWGPHLIVVPTSVILNWEVELKKWCPAFKILTYFGSQKERVEKRKGWSKANAFHVCITSYKVITQDIRAFKQKAWQYFVLDEAQNIKNFKSQRWQMLLNVRSRRRLLLTGTPLQNSLMELWSLMHFLMPAIFASHNDFKDWFNNPLTDMMEGNTEWNSAIVLRLHKVLRPFILRRLKSDVERQLPEKSEQIIICPLSKRQRYLYDDFMSQKTTKENLRSGNVMSVLNIVMQLRKCCNHPNLFEARPILSPLALRPLNIVLPGLLMDFCNNGMKVDPPNIPDSLLFGRRAYESHFTLNERRRLVVYRSYMEEIREQKEIIPMPSRKEFKFNCQQPEKHRFFSQLLPQKAASLSSSHQISEGEILGKPEYYVSMDESGDCARVYEVLTNSAGERIMRECDPTTFASGNAPILLKNRTSQMPSQEGLRTSNASQLVAEMNERKKNVNADDRDVASASSNLTSSSRFSINPAFRTRTVSNRNVPRSGNFIRETDSMTSNGSVMMDDDVFVAKSARIDANIPKVNSVEVNASNVSNHPSVGDKFISYRNTSKKNDDSLFTRNSSELRAALNYEKNARCDRLAHINFQRIFKENALIPFELLYILTNKFCSQGKSKKFDEELEIISYLKEIPKRLNLWLEEVMERFMIYVHAAVTDPPTLVCSSSGMSSYLNDLRKSSEEKCRTAFIKRSNLASHNAFISQKLQFPELRLIEYDCGKLQILNQLLRDLFLYKHRCLIFTQMSRMLDVLQAFLSFHGYQYFRLDGSTGIEQRQALMERFNADPKIFCFILSTRSGGIGVNLTGADTVIFYDSDWNPTMDAQAQDRCHRIGQTRNVTIYRLISERTIEENILKKAMQKRRLGELAIDEAGFTPEYFKGDNIRDLFKNDTSLSDVMPVSVADKAELEKAMATFEDAQDVVAAKRANAEAKAELAEFDEGQIPDTNLDKSDSRYYEVFNQLKPIERYAIKFLEAEYKPDLEEEVKEAEAMLASKKNEWLKAQNEVVVEDVSASDDEFGLTYPNELVISGISDEVHNKGTSKKLSIRKRKIVKKKMSVPLRTSTRCANLLKLKNSQRRMTKGIGSDVSLRRAMRLVKIPSNESGKRRGARLRIKRSVSEEDGEIREDEDVVQETTRLTAKKDNLHPNSSLKIAPPLIARRGRKNVDLSNVRTVPVIRCDEKDVEDKIDVVGEDDSAEPIASSSYKKNPYFPRSNPRLQRSVDLLRLPEYLLIRGPSRDISLNPVGRPTYQQQQTYIARSFCSQTAGFSDTIHRVRNRLTLPNQLGGSDGVSEKGLQKTGNPCRRIVLVRRRPLYSSRQNEATTSARSNLSIDGTMSSSSSFPNCSSESLERQSDEMNYRRLRFVQPQPRASVETEDAVNRDESSNSRPSLGDYERPRLFFRKR